MIETLRLKFGSGPAQPALELPAAPMTIFVGPNNSGKSEILREIAYFCVSGVSHLKHVLLDNIEFASFSETEAKGLLASLVKEPTKQDHVNPSGLVYGKGPHRFSGYEDDIIKALMNPNDSSGIFCHQIARMHLTKLDATSRVGLVKPQPLGDLQKDADNLLGVLFRNNELRREVRKIALEAFGLHLVVDATLGGQVRLRFAKTPPKDELQEKGLHASAVEYHRSNCDIIEMSDGVKAFTGTIVEVVAGTPSIILIDEPEAFLHPSLAFLLGREVARLAAKTDKRVFVATHSAHFIMGCIQAAARTNIVRLTYQNELATARMLPKEQLLPLMRNPLLRSTRVLEGLFYESVVVTEGDTDRAFYEEVNERLLLAQDPRGIKNCLFLNAQNKQTTHAITRPLRELGIPAASVVDIDILKNGGQEWTNYLKGGVVPPMNHPGLGQLRAAIFKACEATKKCMKRDGGISILPNVERNAATDLFDQLAAYGLFVVRGGELESWLKQVGANGKKTDWLINIFEKMGESSSDPNYVEPGDGDVWDFIGQIGNWVRNSQRKGIPEEQVTAP